MKIDLAPGKKTYVIAGLVLLFVVLRNAFGIEVTEADLDRVLDALLAVFGAAATTIRMALSRIEQKVDKT